MSLKSLYVYWQTNKSKIVKQDFLGKEYAKALQEKVKKEMVNNHPPKIQHLLLSVERKLALLSHNDSFIQIRHDEPIDVSPILTPKQEIEKPKDKKELLMEALKEMLRKAKDA